VDSRTSKSSSKRTRCRNSRKNKKKAREKNNEVVRVVEKMKKAEVKVLRNEK